MIRHTLVLALLVLAVVGCRSYVPVHVTLRHGRTGKPVSGAAVRPSYQYFLDPFHPDVRPRVTSSDGTAIIPVSLSDRFVGFFIASPYMTDSPEGQMLITLPDDKLKAVRRAAQLRANDRVPILLAVEVLPREEWLEEYRSRSP